MITESLSHSAYRNVGNHSARYRLPRSGFVERRKPLADWLPDFSVRFSTERVKPLVGHQAFLVQIALSGIRHDFSGSAPANSTLWIFTAICALRHMQWTMGIMSARYRG